MKTYTILFAQMSEEAVHALHNALMSLPMQFAEPFVQTIRQQKAQQDAAQPAEGPSPQPAEEAAPTPPGKLKPVAAAAARKK